MIARILPFMISIFLIPFEFCLAQNHVLNQIRWSNQRYPAIERLSNGNLVVGWYSGFTVGTPGIYMNIFTDELTPLNDVEFLVSSRMQHSREQISFAASVDSFFVAAFTSFYASNDSANMDVYIRKFANDGSGLSQDVRVNEDTLGQQVATAVIIDDLNDRIFVAWYSEDSLNNDLRSYYFRQFDFQLESQSAAIPIYDQDDATIRMTDFCQISSDTLIAGFYRAYSYPFYETVAKSLTYDGSYQSDIVPVGTLGGEGYHPDILPIEGRKALIVWPAFDAIYETSIWGRRFFSDMEPLDNSETLLSVPDSDNDGYYAVQNSPRVASDTADNIYCLVWSQDNSEGSAEFRILGRFIDTSLNPASDTFTISEELYADSPGIVALGEGEFAVCWEALFLDNNGADIIGAIVRYEPSYVHDHERPIDSFMFSSYPNPFNSTVRFSYIVEKSGPVDISVYNLMGQRVDTPVVNAQESGRHEISWSCDECASGIYIAKLQANDSIRYLKIAYLK